MIHFTVKALIMGFVSRTRLPWLLVVLLMYWFLFGCGGYSVWILRKWVVPANSKTDKKEALHLCKERKRFIKAGHWFKVCSSSCSCLLHKIQKLEKKKKKNRLKNPNPQLKFYGRLIFWVLGIHWISKIIVFPFLGSIKNHQ